MVNPASSSTLILILALVGVHAFAAPIGSQSGNLLANGSFESGSFNPVVGHGVASAAANWFQWSNSGSAVTTELITEAEMIAMTGEGVIDGNAAVMFTTQGAGDGGFTFESFGHPGWNVQADVTLSGWVYVLSGTMGLFMGSNSPGHFDYTQSISNGAWEYISISKAGGPTLLDRNNEPLLYSIGGPATFIVDALWLNEGLTSNNPTQNVPLPAPLPVFLLGLLVIAARGLLSRVVLR